MGDLNKVQLIGRLGADPEIRSFQSGDKVANLRIATSERWKDKQTGERKEKTEWHSIAVFGDGLVGIVERYTKKGSQIYVEGALQTRKWQDQQGNDRYSTEIVLRPFAGTIQLLGDANGNGGQGGGNGGGGQRQQGGQSGGGSQRGLGWNESQNGPGRGGSTGGGFQDDLDDDIPF